MKKPQRNFVVEFKGGSRRQIPKPNSIWGNVDLKAISLAVEADDPRQVVQATSKNANSAASNLRTRDQMLTNPVEQPKTVLSTQEEHMAEETAPALNADNTSIETATPIVEPKKRRGRQAKTLAPKTASVDAKTAPTKPAKKPRVAKSEALVAAGAKVAAKQPRKTRMPKNETAAASTPTAHEMADLLQLEGENQKLRKQLAEKLRAENADLRKRLGNS